MPRNPLSKSGKQTVCDTCGSWTHFKRDCPYNPNATMYGQTQDEDDNIPDGVYAVDGEYEFVSEEPSSQPDKVDEFEARVREVGRRAGVGDVATANHGQTSVTATDPPPTHNRTTYPSRVDPVVSGDGRLLKLTAP